MIKIRIVISNYWYINNLEGQAMSQKLPVDLSSGLKIYLNLMKISEKTTMKIVMQDIFLRLMFNILKNCLYFTMIFLIAIHSMQS